MEKLGKPLESILFVSWCAPDGHYNIQLSQQCKLQGHVDPEIQALRCGLDRIIVLDCLYTSSRRMTNS